MRLRSRSSWLKLARIGTALVLVAVCAWGVRGIDWSKVGQSLRSARLGLVIWAAVINLVPHLWCKAERWKVMLAPTARVGRLRLYYYILIGSAASAVLPARAGEALRVYVLKRRDGVPVSASIGVQVLEKIFELLGLLGVLIPLPFVLQLPRTAKLAIALVVVGGFGGIAVALALAVRSARNPDASARLHQLASGLHSLRSPGMFAAAFGWSVAAYIVDGVEVWLCLVAVGIHISWAAPALVLLGVNIAIAVPSTPGQVGALEAGAVAALALLGVPLSSALAFALVYHVMQLVPVLLAGLSGMRLITEARSTAEPPMVEAS